MNDIIMRALLLLPLWVCSCLALDCQKNIALWEPRMYSAKLVKNDLDCFIDKGGCAKISAACKRRIPQDVMQACSKCHPRYRHVLKNFLARIKELHPEDYVVFKKKYDPAEKSFDILEAKLFKY